MAEFSEKLESGGNLVVTDNDWRIEYYFPGPDLRYKGIRMSISSRNIDKYIQAWRNNFSTYLQLKSMLGLDKDAKFQKVGEEGMIIRIGGIIEGVFIADGWTRSIYTQEQLDRIINDYENSKARAIVIQELLKKC